ncbi:hypothetical protein [Desulfosporosinus sp.]|uniref:hypothetical protein n=1 Tax=Desulfosporosinus sp. TaxID=157907 RepID=UPI0026302998|nr:hypothetical protein [Desulfosporosinus sp.]
MVYPYLGAPFVVYLTMSVMPIGLLMVDQIHTYHTDRYCESLAVAFLGPLTGVQLV